VVQTIRNAEASFIAGGQHLELKTAANRGY
jgi:hypothetical protein